MPNDDTLLAAIAELNEPPRGWMPATGVRSIIFEDPVLVWLEYHGARHGFEPDDSPYQFLDWIAKKARQFQKKWVGERVVSAVCVCQNAYDVLHARTVRRTFQLMREGRLAIAQPALWWAPERVYGVPDLLVHSTWLEENFPALLRGSPNELVAPLLADSDRPGYYLALDMKFTTKLITSSKATDLESASAQIRIYNYMLGHLQGLMPKQAYIITRDQVDDPICVESHSRLGEPLDPDLATIRDQYLDIKLNGSQYVPWRDAIVASNLGHSDEQWTTAKKKIAEERVAGRDPSLLYQVGPSAKRTLVDLGYASLDSILEADPREVPLEECAGLGPKKAKQIRAILRANRSGDPVLPSPALVPERKQFEFYVDFEYLTNLNVDFNTQWPALKGCEMIFLVGVGWEQGSDWAFEYFAAEQENATEELKMFEKFLNWIGERTSNKATNGSYSTLFHWSGAEVWQTRRVGDRHQLAPDHPLRALPWFDLEKIFLKGPCAVPGALNFSLKNVSRALASLRNEYDPDWPGGLDEGLRAMVMGWKAYERPNPLESTEMITLREYLEADCRALWKVLQWLRRSEAAAATA